MRTGHHRSVRQYARVSAYRPNVRPATDAQIDSTRWSSGVEGLLHLPRACTICRVARFTSTVSRRSETPRSCACSEKIATRPAWHECA